MKVYLYHTYKVWGLLIVVALFLFFWINGEKDGMDISHPVMHGGMTGLVDNAAEIVSHGVAEVPHDSGEISRQSLRYGETVAEIALDDITVEKAIDTRIVPVSAWHIEAHEILELRVGDTLVLPLKGIEYPVHITETSRMGHSRVITGLYKDEGNSYPAVITVGKRTTFVSFQTPNGGYQSTLIASEGYVYSSASIEAAYIDRYHSDTVTVTSNRDLDIIPR